ncbi:hypothetical protein VTO73DRAFT_2478 [Trametes versicolor]
MADASDASYRRVRDTLARDASLPLIGPASPRPSFPKHAPHREPNSLPRSHFLHRGGRSHGPPSIAWTTDTCHRAPSPGAVDSVPSDFVRASRRMQPPRWGARVDCSTLDRARLLLHPVCHRGRRCDHPLHPPIAPSVIDVAAATSNTIRTANKRVPDAERAPVHVVDCLLDVLCGLSNQPPERSVLTPPSHCAEVEKRPHSRNRSTSTPGFLPTARAHAFWNAAVPDSSDVEDDNLRPGTGARACGGAFLTRRVRSPSNAEDVGQTSNIGRRRKSPAPPPSDARRLATARRTRALGLGTCCRLRRRVDHRVPSAMLDTERVARDALGICISAQPATAPGGAGPQGRVCSEEGKRPASKRAGPEHTREQAQAFGSPASRVAVRPRSAPSGARATPRRASRRPPSNDPVRLAEPDPPRNRATTSRLKTRLGSKQKRGSAATAAVPVR